MTDPKPSHTPEPWLAAGWTIRDESGDGIAQTASDFCIDVEPDSPWRDFCAASGRSDATADANAARIVACVNPMEGIENPPALYDAANEMLDRLSVVYLEGDTAIKAEMLATWAKALGRTIMVEK